MADSAITPKGYTIATPKGIPAAISQITADSLILGRTLSLAASLPSRQTRTTACGEEALRNASIAPLSVSA
jgi:hypothetical protein